jgi:hypothetical protein
MLGLLMFTVFISPNKYDKKIYVPNVGDNWKLKVDSAMYLINKTDTEKYNNLMLYCDSIDFSNTDFSTTIPLHTIVITKKDIDLNSINNIAAVLVHESRHLYYLNNKIYLTEYQEEFECYKYEYDFLSKLPEIEDWLFINNVGKIIYYENRIKN